MSHWRVGGAILEKPRGILKVLFAQNWVIWGVISTEFYYTKE